MQTSELQKSLRTHQKYSHPVTELSATSKNGRLQENISLRNKAEAAWVAKIPKHQYFGKKLDSNCSSKGGLANWKDFFYSYPILQKYSF